MDNPGNNQHFNVLIWVGGLGLRISTLCTIGKMLTIVNDPLVMHVSRSIHFVAPISYPRHPQPVMPGTTGIVSSLHHEGRGFLKLVAAGSYSRVLFFSYLDCILNSKAYFW